MTANGWLHRGAPCVIAVGLLLAAAEGAAGQTAGAGISGHGIVRICELDGSMLDSAGAQFGEAGPAFITGPDLPFRSSVSCLGRPQTFYVLASADPRARDFLGLRMVSQASIAVDAEPQFTEAYAQSGIESEMCVESDAAAQPTVRLVARSRASRTQLEDCFDELLRPLDSGACSSVRGRFSGLGSVGFIDAQGLEYAPGEFVDLTQSRVSKWTKVQKLARGSAFTGGGWLLDIQLSGTLVAKVAGTPTGSASGDFRFYVEGTRNSVHFVHCQRPTANLHAPLITRPILPTPPWFIDAGDAIPDDFTLAISPPTGPITINQAFDLSVMAATNGAAITSLSGAIDGQDVSGPLAACLQPTAALSGVQGAIFTCRGLSGGFLAGILGTGAHTLSINVSLSDGRTITNSATWTILR